MSEAGTPGWGVPLSMAMTLWWDRSSTAGPLKPLWVNSIPPRCAWLLLRLLFFPDLGPCTAASTPYRDKPTDNTCNS